MILHPLRPPKHINPAAIEFWMEAFDGNNIHQKFEELCYAAGVEPYSRSRVGNSDVRNFLARRRARIVRFINTTDFLAPVVYRRRPVRQVELYPGGFKLTVFVQVNADPTFENWVKAIPLPYRFKRIRQQRRTVLTIDPATTFFVYNPMICERHRWVIGYTINCPMLPHRQHSVTDEQFILNQLWLPVAQARRPINTRPLQI